MAEFEQLIDASKRGALQEAEALVQAHPELVTRRDKSGTTALHYATLGGHRALAKFLVQAGADINATDGQFGATPAGWAIEYLREMGGFLGIELADLAFAIRQGDVEWTRRFLTRFPGLRRAKDIHGNSFKQVARECGNPDIAVMFQTDDDRSG